MIAITDVHYHADAATAALVLAGTWTDAAALAERTVAIPAASPYQPGEFYRRELPALLAVLDASALPPGTTVIVDGYVWLGEGRPGLGAHLWRALAETHPVVGVAKSRFEGAAAVETFRGRSQRPLFVTSAGLAPSEAAAHVASMHGPSRVPTLVTRADQLARGLRSPSHPAPPRPWG
jgi:deoxyribonuclease V